FWAASRPGAPPAQDRERQPPADGQQARLPAQDGQREPPPPQNGKEPPRENGKEPPPQPAGKNPGTAPGRRLSALPDLQLSLPATPAVGRLAVQASPRIHARYAEGRRAVVLILDCSGSMLTPLPGNTTRFKEATRA